MDSNTDVNIIDSSIENIHSDTTIKNGNKIVRDVNGRIVSGVNNPHGRPKKEVTIAEIQRKYLFAEYDEKSERRMKLYRVVQEILESFVKDDTCFGRHERPIEKIKEAMKQFDSDGEFGEHIPLRVYAFVKAQFAEAMKGNTAAQRQLQNYIDGMPTQKVELQDNRNQLMLDVLEDIRSHSVNGTIEEEVSDDAIAQTAANNTQNTDEQLT